MAIVWKFTRNKNPQTRPIKSDWREQQNCLSVRLVGIASFPTLSVQCSKNGLKMKNQKCDILMQPSNAPNCCSRHSHLTGLSQTETLVNRGWILHPDFQIKATPTDVRHDPHLSGRESLCSVFWITFPKSSISSTRKGRARNNRELLEEDQCDHQIMWQCDSIFNVTVLQILDSDPLWHSTG